MTTDRPSPQDMNAAGIVAKPTPYDPVSWAHLRYWTAVVAEQASQRHGVKSHLLTNCSKTAGVCAARVEVVWNLRRQWMQTFSMSPKRFQLTKDYYTSVPDGQAWQPLSFPIIGELMNKDHSGVLHIWRRAQRNQSAMPELPILPKEEAPASTPEYHNISPASTSSLFVDADKRVVGVSQ